MGKVYRNNKEIPIPDFAYVNHSDARVFTMEVDEFGKKIRKVIGYATSDKTMQPNDRFRTLYPTLWKESYPTEKFKPHTLHVGTYALTLGICDETHLYSILQDIYGPQYANAILDYAMFSIRNRSSVTQVFEDSMAEQVLFSDRPYSDSWYSDFFKNKIEEDQHHQFRIRWVQNAVQQGARQVWICIDGSNNDCVVEKSELSEFGHPKSHNDNKQIVGYMYAINADDGRPITYFTYPGSIPDIKAFQQIATFLSGFNLEIEGVILDRGFVGEDVLATIESFRWKYVIMLPSDTHGHQLMLDAFCEKIRWNTQYLVSDSGVFGIAEKMQLFRNNPRTSTISLFFDGISGSHQSVRLLKKVTEEKRRIENLLAQGKNATVGKQFNKYLRIEPEGNVPKLVVLYENWNTGLSIKGFYSMATSDGISPIEADSIYRKRDASETQYSILKSQEGYDTTRVHYTEGIESKFAIAFISSIIRAEIMISCQEINEDTNLFIQHLDRVGLLLMPDGSYSAVKNLDGAQKELFQKYGLSQADFVYFAQETNHRLNRAVNSPVHLMPPKDHIPETSNSHKRGRKPKNNLSQQEAMPITGENAEKNKGGRPKGSKDTKPRKQRSDKGKPRGKRAPK